MGSVAWEPENSTVMSAMSFIAPLLDLASNQEVQEKVTEAAKLFYTGDDVTINLIPGLIAGGLLLLLAIPLMSLLLQPAESSASGYGAPTEEYGAPAAEYGAPSYSASYRSDEGYGEGLEQYRSLFNNLLEKSQDPTSPQFALTRRMQDLAGPGLTKLGQAAAQLIQ